MVYRSGANFAYVEQMADFIHNSTIHFFTLVTEDGQWHAESTEDLLDQDSGNRFGFLGFGRDSLGPFGERIMAGENVDVLLVPPGMRSGKVDIPSFARGTRRYWSKQTLSGWFSAVVPCTGDAMEAEVPRILSPVIPVELSLDLVDRFSLVSVSTGAASMALFNDFEHISSWYKKLEVVVLTRRCVFVSSVNKVVVDLELVPAAD